MTSHSPSGSPTQFSVLRYESMTHEFDPYFSYRSNFVHVGSGAEVVFVYEGVVRPDTLAIKCAI